MTYCNNIHHKPPSRMTLVMKTHLETFRGYVRGGYHGLIGQYLVFMCSQGSPPKIEGGPRKSCNYLPPPTPIAVKIAFARGARGDFRLPLLMAPALAQGVSPATEKKLVIVRDARIVKFAG